MECRAYAICMDGQSGGHLSQDRKVPSTAGGNLSRMHKTEKTAKESRMNLMYSHLCDTTLAITTLAGARLILSSKSWEVLHDFQPFIGGFTLFFWATGTWWIPLLVIVGFWRHVVERVPVTYDPQYWSLVFPLGMYTVATLMFANATGMPFLLIIPRIAVYIAMLAWLITFSAMLFKLGNFCLAYGQRKTSLATRAH